MSTLEIVERAKRRLETLTADRLKVADDFLAFLEDRESEEATAELLSLPGFVEELQRAEADVAAGRVTPVDQLRRKS